MSYNRSSSASGGGAGMSSGPGTWPDGTSKATTSRGDRPDPRDPQRPPGVSTPGKSFMPRPELIASGYRGGDPVLIGPGSEQWTRGADLVLNKQSLSTSQVAGPRRRRPK